MEEGSKEDKRDRGGGIIMALCRHCLKVVASNGCNCVKFTEVSKITSKVVNLSDYKKRNKR